VEKGSKKFKDFRAHVGSGENIPAIQALAEEVKMFSRQFPVIGFDLDDMRYWFDLVSSDISVCFVHFLWTEVSLLLLLLLLLLFQKYW